MNRSGQFNPSLTNTRMVPRYGIPSYAGSAPPQFSGIMAPNHVVSIPSLDLHNESDTIKISESSGRSPGSAMSMSNRHQSQMALDSKSRINQSSTRDIIAAVVIFQFVFLFIMAILFSADGGFFTAGVFYVALVSNLLAFFANLYRFSTVLYVFGGIGSICVFLYHAYVYALVAGTLVGYRLSATLLGRRTLLYFVGTVGGSYEVLLPSVVLHYWIVRSLLFFGLCLSCLSSVSITCLYFLSSGNNDASMESRKKAARTPIDVESLTPMSLSINPIQKSPNHIEGHLALANLGKSLECYSPESPFNDIQNCSVSEENDTYLQRTSFDHLSRGRPSKMYYYPSNDGDKRNLSTTNWNENEQHEIILNESLIISPTIANSSLSTCTDSMLQVKMGEVFGDGLPQNDICLSSLLSQSRHASAKSLNSSVSSIESTSRGPRDNLPLSPSPPTRTIARVCTPTMTTVYPFLSGSSQSGFDLETLNSIHADNSSDYFRIQSRESDNVQLEESIDAVMENVPIH